MRILNRKVRWEVNQILYQCDEKHVHTIIREMGLQKDSRGLDSPVVQESENVTEGDELDRSEAYKYRHLAATVNYLSMDRLDVQFAASVLGRAMSRPRVQSMVALKRVARYLLKHPSMEFEYSRTSIEEASVMEGYSDSDWAGCRATRRSMSGGIVTLGRLRLEVLEQSTGLRGTFRAARQSTTLPLKLQQSSSGLRSLAKDLGWNVGLQLKIDSSAAKAITSRLGAGKVRHLEVRFLWLQEVTRNKQLQVVKVRGKANLADVLEVFPRDVRTSEFSQGDRLQSRVRLGRGGVSGIVTLLHDDSRPCCVREPRGWLNSPWL